MLVLLLVQPVVILRFGFQKQGYHYDEYYSYYSSDVTHSLNPTDMEWKDELEKENGGFSRKEMMLGLLYCDLYELKR